MVASLPSMQQSKRKIRLTFDCNYTIALRPDPSVRCWPPTSHSWLSSTLPVSGELFVDWMAVSWTSGGGGGKGGADGVDGRNSEIRIKG